MSIVCKYTKRKTAERWPLLICFSFPSSVFGGYLFREQQSLSHIICMFELMIPLNNGAIFFVKYVLFRSINSCLLLAYVIVAIYCGVFVCVCVADLIKDFVVMALYLLAFLFLHPKTLNFSY